MFDGLSDNWSKENPDEPGLPGLSFTNRQLFWISYGQLGCMKYHDAALRKMILTGYHAPGEWLLDEDFDMEKGYLEFSFFTR